MWHNISMDKDRFLSSLLETKKQKLPNIGGLFAVLVGEEGDGGVEDEVVVSEGGGVGLVDA